MSCKTHDWRVIDDYIPPRSEDEPAWCRSCGALRANAPPMFGVIDGGVRILHPLSDRSAPTILNIAANAMKKDRPSQDAAEVTLTAEEHRKIVVMLDLAGVPRRPRLVPGPEHRLLARLMVALGELHDLKDAARNDNEDLQ